jgi:hypothetical protein
LKKTYKYKSSSKVFLLEMETTAAIFQVKCSLINILYL